MRIWKRLSLITVALLLMLTLARLGNADFGGFSGDSDYGSSSSSDSDWGSSSSYSSSDHDYGSSSGGSGELSPGMIAIIAVFVVIYLMSKRGLFKKRTSTSGGQPAGATPTHQSQLRPISELIESDPNFSEAAMRETISELYIRFQKAWQHRNLATVRPYLSQRLYAQVSKQLQNDYIDKHLTSYLDNIAVLDVQIRGFTSGDQEELTAYLRTRFINYTVNDDTGAVVKGDKRQEVFMEYEWTLARNQGVKTRPGGGTIDANCPNCGGIVDLAVSSKCIYCGTVLDIREEDWVVANIKGISQQGRGN